MIHQANNLTNKKLLIITPSLRSLCPISYEDLGSYFVPADAFKKFRKLDNPNAGKVIIIGSMSFGNHSHTQLKENYKNYYDAKLLFHKMNIEIDLFSNSNNFYCKYLLETIFAHLKSKNMVDLKTGKLKIESTLDILMNYFSSCDIKPEKLILENSNIDKMMSSNNFNFLTNKVEKGSYSTCFKRNLYFDPTFTETILDITKIHEIIELLDNDMTNLYKISYVNSKTISQEMIFKTSILISLQNPLLIPNVFVTSDRVIPSPYRPLDFVEDLELPFISDILRISLLSTFPFNEQHNSSISVKKLYNTYVKKYRVVIINIAIRISNVLIKLGGSQTHHILKHGTMVYNTYRSEESIIKDEDDNEVKKSKLFREIKNLTYSKMYETLLALISNYRSEFNKHNYSSAINIMNSYFTTLQKIFIDNKPWTKITDAHSKADAMSETTLMFNFFIAGLSMLQPIAPQMAEVLIDIIKLKRCFDFNYITEQFIKQEPILKVGTTISSTKRLKEARSIDFGDAFTNFTKLHKSKIYER